MADLAIPQPSFDSTTGDQPFADLDGNFAAIVDWINTRRTTAGLLANRPPAGNQSALYLATDVQGGTLYVDDGTQWVQAAGTVTQQAPQNTVIILASHTLVTL